ncbi:hypothetical protein [uncultured Alistipes sp.]|uniref:hypothetical protein n=1 Tax=uncultured Alistipes sp. TaxID=538949 RepID=UPI0025A60787|nr:hypothetical protein [uncultured Alistipes sp.]MCX4282479.1 hypothetical protein [Alistipes sp.]
MKEEQTTKNPAEFSAEAASGSATGRRRRSRGRSRGHQNGQNAQQASAQSAGSASQKSQQNAGQRAQQNSGRPNRPARGTAAGNRKPGNPAGRNSAGSRSWGDYMRQLLVVIVGVALTLAAAGLVERWREARQVRGVMQLVSEELKANRALTAEACRGIALLDEYGRDYGRIPADTLEKYRSDVERAAGFAPQSDALEVLRLSGAMAAVQDRQLLLEVLECYAYLERFGAAVNNYNSLETALGDCFGPETLDGGAVEHVDRVLRQLDERYGFGR